MTKMSIKVIKRNCRNYLSSRKKFLEFAKNCELLQGNDNIIGSRIGEFIAWEFLNNKKRKPIINTLSNVADYDIICKDNGAKVSVKLISPENKIGRTTRLGKNWDEFLLIVLDDNYKVFKIGHITKDEFKKAMKQKAISETPFTSRSMLGLNGLFKFGKIYNGNTVRSLI